MDESTSHTHNDDQLDSSGIQFEGGNALPQPTEQLLAEIDPWSETKPSVITFETEVVPLVFAGQELDTADAWAGSGEERVGQSNNSTLVPVTPLTSPPPNLVASEIAKVYWKSIRGKFVPPEAIPIGRDSDGAPLFASRVEFKNGVHVGKARNNSGCLVSWGGKEYLMDESTTYEVLCGQASSIEWAPATGKVSAPLIRSGRLIEGGQEDGQPQFVGICDTYLHGTQVGKCGPLLDGLHYAYAGKEINIRQYKIALYGLATPEESSTKESQVSGTVYWSSASVRSGVPAGAIRIGRDSDGSPLYAGRVKVSRGGIQVGKVRLDGGCYVAYGGKELQFKSDFEVLCGDSNVISLEEVEGAITLSKLAELKLIEAGHEENGMPLHLGIVDAFGSIQIGKASPTLSGVHFSYAGKEHVAKKFRLLVYC